MTKKEFLVTSLFLIAALAVLYYVAQNGTRDFIDLVWGAM